MSKRKKPSRGSRPTYGERSTNVKKPARYEELTKRFYSGDEKAGKELHKFFEKGTTEHAELQEYLKECRKEEHDNQVKTLLKNIPALRKIKEQVNKALFDDLVKDLLKELDGAISTGYYGAPSGGGSPSPNAGGRGDTWTCAPGTHGTSCPCVGPHIPGPSGLW